jgi:hypothetical protein
LLLPRKYDFIPWQNIYYQNFISKQNQAIDRIQPHFEENMTKAQDEVLALPETRLHNPPPPTSSGPVGKRPTRIPFLEPVN